jgi:membrane protease YdiL (CAAX protease family)
MKKPEAPSKSVLYLIAAGIGWELLARVPALLLSGVILGFQHSQSRPFPSELRSLLGEIAILSAYSIFLLSAFIQGRIIGDGDVRAGCGYEPVSRRPIVALLAILVAARATQWNIIVYERHPSLFYEQFAIDAANPWLTVYSDFKLILVEPLCEELFYRGWLWTGLRRHWGGLTTAALTGTIWLALHLSVSADSPAWLLPVAIILSLARHFGGSVRASIALHMLYNSIIVTLPWVLEGVGLL